MKWWWVLVVVLLVPVGSQAKEFMEPAVTINIEGMATDWPQKEAGWEYPKFTLFVVEPKETLQDVSIHMEFSLPGRSGHHLEHLHAERCEVLFVNSDQTPVQVFPTRNGDDLDLWIPHFAVGTQIGVVVWWKDTTKSGLAQQRYVKSHGNLRNSLRLKGIGPFGSPQNLGQFEGQFSGAAMGKLALFYL